MNALKLIRVIEVMCTVIVGIMRHSDTGRKLEIVFGRVAFLVGRSMFLRTYGPLRNENPDGSNSIKVRIFKV